MGWRLELSDVAVTPLFPPAFAALSVDDFLRRLPELDADFKTRAAEAAARGEALRYAASIEGGALTVGPTTVPLSSPLGSLSGTDNLCEFYSKWCARRFPPVRAPACPRPRRGRQCWCGRVSAPCPHSRPHSRPRPLRRYPTSPLVVRGAGAGAGTTAAGILADMVEMAFAASVDFRAARLGAPRAETHPSFEE